MVQTWSQHFELKDDIEEEDDQREQEYEEGDKDELDEELEEFETKEIDHDITLSAFIGRLSCFPHSLQLIRFDEVSSYQSVRFVRVHMSTEATEKLI